MSKALKITPPDLTIAYPLPAQLVYQPRVVFELGVLRCSPPCPADSFEGRQVYLIAVIEVTLDRLTIRARHQAITFRVMIDYRFYPALGCIASTMAIYSLKSHGQNHKD
jgi:hypothetical protein